MRISGLGETNAVLFDVVCEVTNEHENRLFRDDRSPELKALERRKSVVEQLKLVRRHEAESLTQYGYSYSSEYSNPKDIVEYLEIMKTRMEAAIEAAAKLDEELEVINERIAQENRAYQKRSKRSTALGSVTAVIMAQRRGHVEITLTYCECFLGFSFTYNNTDL